MAKITTGQLYQEWQDINTKLQLQLGKQDEVINKLAGRLDVEIDNLPADYPDVNAAQKLADLENKITTLTDTLNGVIEDGRLQSDTKLTGSIVAKDKLINDSEFIQIPAESYSQTTLEDIDIYGYFDIAFTKDSSAPSSEIEVELHYQSEAKRTFFVEKPLTVTNGFRGNTRVEALMSRVIVRFRNKSNEPINVVRYIGGIPIA